jgi:hypothetical protein
MLFLSGTKVSLIGVPQQWLDDNDRPGPTKKQKSSGSGQEGNSGGGLPRTDGDYGKGGTPWDMDDSNRKPAAQQKKNGAGNNPVGPPAFAQSSEIKALLQRHRDVQLGMVAVAAGFGGTTDLPTNGLPKDCCLLWLCFGKCTYDKCRRSHPTSVDIAAAHRLYMAILPSINKLKESNVLPPPPARK